MRLFSFLTTFVLAFILSLVAPVTASAQSWKPVCVNGSNAAGRHNSTWQKVNTPSSGGSTWKKAGGCVPPPPPPPPTCANGAPNYPTCTFPPQGGIDLSGIPNPIISSSADPYKQEWAQITFGTDGVWSANTGSYNPSYPSSGPNAQGRYLTNGAVATDYEIMISNLVLRNGSTVIYGRTLEQSDAFINTWTNAGTGIPGYQPVFQGVTSLTGCQIESDCVGGGAPTLTFTVTVRRIDNHAQTDSITLTLGTTQSYYY